MTFSEKLLQLRKERGLSQEELGAKLGVSRQTISKWELGSALPDAVNLLAISQYFQISVDALLDNTSAVSSDRHTAFHRFLYSHKCMKLLQEKGYRGGYILIGYDVIALLMEFFLIASFLSVLSAAAPLRMLPPQAFLLPAIGGIVSLFTLARLLLHIRLTRLLKKL